MDFIRTRGASWGAGLCALVLFSGIAQADMWLLNFGGISPTVARRFRESDAGFVGLLDYGPEVATGMRLGPNGRIYVAVNELNQGRIARFDAATGQPLGDLVPFGQAGYEQPGNFVFGANGDLYAPSSAFTANGQSGVLRFDGTSGAFESVFIAPGAGGLTSFADIETMPTSTDLLICDTNRVNRYDGTTGAFVSTFITPGAAGTGALGNLTFGPDGNLYLSDFTHHEIRRFDGNTGAFIDVFVEQADLLSTVRGMSFGNDGNLYVSQRGANVNMVRRYDGGTGEVIDTFLTADWVYTDPTEIVFTPEPTMLIAPLTIFIIAAHRRRR